MFKEESVKALIKEILKEEIFVNMTYEELNDSIELIKQYLDERKAEYAFRVHMENGLELYDELNYFIKDYVKVYQYFIRNKKIKEDKKSSQLIVRDLNKNEEYNEKRLLKIPKKTILLPKKEENIKTVLCQMMGKDKNPVIKKLGWKHIFMLLFLWGKLNLYKS